MIDYSLEELELLWNKQADQWNSWIELGLDEIVAFAQQVARQWQPIESAPLETRILLMYETLRGHVEDGYVYGDSPDRGLYYVLFDGDSLNKNPTHWMPLPKAPGNNNEHPK